MKNVKKINGEKNVPQEKFDQAVEETKQALTSPPTPDQVREWLGRDIDAAFTLLGLIRQSPVLMDKMANDLYELASKPRIESVQTND